MPNESDLDAAWRNVLKCEAAVKDALVDCRKQGRQTDRYKNCKADAEKARAEYAKLNGGRPHDPLDPESGDKYTTQKVLRAFLGDRRDHPNIDRE